MGQGEVGMCTRRVQTAWPCLGSFIEMAMSGLRCRNAWVSSGGPFLLCWAQKKLKQAVSPCGASISRNLTYDYVLAV